MQDFLDCCLLSIEERHRIITLTAESNEVLLAVRHQVGLSRHFGGINTTRASKWQTCLLVPRIGRMKWRRSVVGGGEGARRRE